MNHNTFNIALVILAAGESKRMNRPKQMLPWKGSTLLSNAIREALNSKTDHIYVTLGANYDLIYNTHKQYPVTFLHNTTWEKGLGNTIAYSIAQIKSLNYDGVLLVLADQPQVDSAYLDLLISKFTSIDKTQIIATSYETGFGVPLLFGNAYFKDLTENTNPNGARQILTYYKNCIVPIKPETILSDIDTPEEYQYLYSQYH